MTRVPLLSSLRYTPAAHLELSGPAHFGVTVADGKVLSQEVSIINEGSLSGKFKIKYAGNQPITIMPTGGVVKPGERQPIKVRKYAHWPCWICCFMFLLCTQFKK